MKRIAAGLLAVLVLLVMSAAGPAGVAAQPKEVVIGVLYPMSGPNAQPGIDNKPVIEIGADIANGGPSIVLQTLNVADAEKVLIQQALEATDNNRTRAAELLGMSVRTLRNKLNAPGDDEAEG